MRGFIFELSILFYWSIFLSLCQYHTDARKDRGKKEKRASEDEMAGWHHQCNGHELGQTLGDGEGQGGLVCCSSWHHKESGTTGQLNNNSTYLREKHFKTLASVSHQKNSSIKDIFHWKRYLRINSDGITQLCFQGEKKVLHKWNKLYLYAKHPLLYSLQWITHNNMSPDLNLGV